MLARCERRVILASASREETVDGRWRRREGMHSRLQSTGCCKLVGLACRVSLSQTNGLRLFDAVFHQNLLFIIPLGPRNDIGPCLLVVALMSLIAPPVRKRIAASHRPESHGSQQTLKRVPRFPFPPLPSRSVHSRVVRIKIAKRNSISRFAPR